jgi:hypothetical protein
MFGDESLFNEHWMIQTFFKSEGGRFRKCLFSRAVNERIELRNSFLANLELKTRSILPDMLKSTDKHYVFPSGEILWNGSMYRSKYTIKTVEKLIDQGRATLYLTDPVSFFVNNNTELVPWLSKFKNILTYSKSDAQQYGFKLLPFGYFEDKDYGFRQQISESPTKDFGLLQFVGDDAFRRAMTAKLISTASETNLDFNFSSGGDAQFKHLENYVSRGYANDFRARCGDVNCMVMFSAHHANYLSGSCLESLTFGRKLLTTSKLIQDLPCYDDRFIKVIESPDDITEDVLDWMKAREDVQFDNLECISVPHFIKELTKLCQ